jgi:hypothetical protein
MVTLSRGAENRISQETDQQKEFSKKIGGAAAKGFGASARCPRGGFTNGSPQTLPKPIEFYPDLQSQGNNN